MEEGGDGKFCLGHVGFQDSRPRQLRLTIRREFWCRDLDVGIVFIF